jgi:hypothetical protein
VEEGTYRGGDMTSDERGGKVDGGEGGISRDVMN